MMTQGSALQNESLNLNDALKNRFVLVESIFARQLTAPATGAGKVIELLRGV